MTQTVAAATGQRAAGPIRVMWEQEDRFRDVLPASVDVKAFLGTASGALYADEKLMAAAASDMDSLIVALMKCAALGHLPGTDEFYLTPRGRKGGGSRVLGIEGYRGVIERMYRSGAVAKVVVREVCAKDKFRFVDGVDVRPVHFFGGGSNDRQSTGGDFFGPKGTRDRGLMVGAYAYADLLSGATSRVVLLSRDDWEAARAAGGWTPDDKFNPWNRLDAGPGHPEFTGRSMVWKGLALDTPIPTPSGWTTMGAIRQGDLVLDRDGSPVLVTGVSEIKHKTCYRLRFRSGPDIVCDDEHLWVARVKRENERVRTIGELYEAKQAGKPVVMPVARPLDLPVARLPVDPWVLGYWLGNGKQERASVTCHSDDAQEVAAAIASAGCIVGAVRKDPRSLACQIGIRGGLTKTLADLGVLGAKHVPAVYLRGSFDQRLALLRGMMDSDGHVVQRGPAGSRVTFTSTSRHLRDAVAELARSLGEQVWCGEITRTGYGKIVLACEATWTPSVVPFTVARKAARVCSRQTRRGHSVIAIDQVPPVPTVCIRVDSPTSTFLAGTAMIPTHNTAAKRLEPWVPTSAEFKRSQMRAASDAVRLEPRDQALLTRIARDAVDEDGVHEAEIVDEPAAPAIANGEPEVATALPATQGQRTVIGRRLSSLGFSDAEDAERTRYVARLARRDIADVRELTRDEAQAVSAALKECGSRADLDALLAGGEKPGGQET